MIENAAWKNILLTADDFTTVVEFYASDAVPGATGFAPASALARYATVAGVSFVSQTYTRLIKNIGNINRTITEEVNSADVTFSNVSRVISRFEFNTGFEGLIMVVRLISRSLSTTIDKSQILFTGRCEQPKSGDKDSLTVTATWILGGLEVQIPRRKFAKEDQEGRVSTNPNFEGFLFIPQYGVTGISVRVRRGGFLGFFGFKKTVQQTLPFSSFSDLDANKPIPEVFGRSQLLGSHIAYDDSGTTIRLRTAFCEGKIDDIINARSMNTKLPLSGDDYVETYGSTGAANAIGAAWVGPGNYSRTALIVGKATGSTFGDVEPAPEIAAVIKGRLMTIPTSAGAWTVTDIWTDNAAAHVRFLITSSDYFKLDPAWCEDADFNTAFLYNDQLIIDRSLTDFAFVRAG